MKVANRDRALHWYTVKMTDGLHLVKVKYGSGHYVQVLGMAAWLRERGDREIYPSDYYIQDALPALMRSQYRCISAPRR